MFKNTPQVGDKIHIARHLGWGATVTDANVKDYGFFSIVTLRGWLKGEGKEELGKYGIAVIFDEDRSSVGRLVFALGKKSEETQQTHFDLQ